MTHTLFKEFNALASVVNTARAKKFKTLKHMNGLVGSFDESCLNTPAEEHIEGYWAVVIIEDAGDDSGADSYRNLHPQLMDAMTEEKLAFDELVNFLFRLNLVAVNDTNEPLSVLGIRSGKIIVDVIGRA